MRYPCLRTLLFPAGVALGLAVAGCGPADTTATAYLTWQIVDAKDPNPKTAPALSCESKGVATIRVQMFPSTPGSLIDFPCASMAGETRTLPAGNYTVQTLALSASAQALAQLTFEQKLFGQTNLGLIVFQIH
jgi:hypothetical protein